jgi:hypothetical protein
VTVVCGFPHFLQENSGILPIKESGRFLPLRFGLVTGYPSPGRYKFFDIDGVFKKKL